ncbi:AraC family transcriptional regulator [Halpernia frigidisoli]|uniref:AraC-type DNA-binding protein n=1 Tax=Halpernia frigidisoli TaxID=1125876 RepID=A0A1I3F0L5_9FLAO|nr:AraC family transcriptional regulator [Halpernia frigidisoli]SFI04733.1 AraC-type DNA-binding protein [Halpernia frigidisoli]
MIKTISISDLLNKPTEKVEFVVDRFEEMEEPENIEFPHNHNFYEILWITNGSSKHTIDFKNYEIEADTLFFISPGQLHLFEEWQDINGYCIAFTEDFFLHIFQNKNILFELSYLDNMYENPFIKIKQQDKSKLKAIVDLLLNEKAHETIQALIYVFLKQIQTLFSEKGNSQNSKHQIVIFKQFKNLVDENFTKSLALTEYANQLNVTLHNLNSIVKSVCNKTTSEIINERTILEAKRLLQFSDDNISEISYKLGFEDSSYFARYFKKHTSSSPLDFRKNIF